MSNPRLRHLPSAGKTSSYHTGKKTPVGKLAAEFADRQADFARRIKQKFGEEWIIDTPQVNPFLIIEQAKQSAISSAMMCQQACMLLALGHKKRVHEYMIAAYAVALSLRGNDRDIKEIASEVSDGRSRKKGISPDKFESDILHYLFVYVFFQSGLTTRNRAWQWADSLQAYFDDSRDLNDVTTVLKRYGQNKLRVVTLEIQKAIESEKRKTKADVSLSKNVDDALAKDVIAESETSTTITDGERIVDYGERGLPPTENMPAEEEHNDEFEGDDESVRQSDSTGRTLEQSESLDDNESLQGDLNGSADAEMIDRRLQQMFITTLNLGAKIVEPDLNKEGQKKLLPAILMLGDEIIKLRRLLADR